VVNSADRRIHLNLGIMRRKQGDLNKSTKHIDDALKLQEEADPSDSSSSDDGEEERKKPKKRKEEEFVYL